MAQETEIQITFIPERIGERTILDIADELGLHTVVIVDDVLSGKVSGDVKVGSLGSGFVDLDGKDIGVTVNFPSLTLQTTLYADSITSILVNGRESYPSYQTNFPKILDDTTRKVFDDLLDASLELLTSIIEKRTISPTDLMRLLDHPDTRQVFMNIASLSEQFKRINSGSEIYLDDFRHNKGPLINGLGDPNASEFRSVLELFIGHLRLIGGELIPQLEQA